MSERFVDGQEIEKNLSWLERMVDYFSSDDEYRSAMLRNQRIQTEILADQLGVGMGQATDPTNMDLEDLPKGLVGSTESRIPSGDKGRAVFDISGSKYRAQVRAEEDLEKNEAVVVNGDGNSVRASSSAHDALSMLVGSGAAGRSTVIRPGSFTVHDTSDLEGSNDLGSVVVEPGDKVPLARAEGFNQGAYLLAAGASDAQGVTFALRVDEEHIVGGITNSPLGTMSSPFSFNQNYGGVVPATEKVEYIAIYDDEATGQVELTARLDVQELGQ